MAEQSKKSSKLNIVITILFAIAAVLFLIMIFFPKSGRLVLISEASGYLFILAAFVPVIRNVYEACADNIKKAKDEQEVKTAKRGNKIAIIFLVPIGIAALIVCTVGLVNASLDLKGGTSTMVVSNVSVARHTTPGNKAPRRTTYYVKGNAPSGKEVELEISKNEYDLLAGTDFAEAEYYPHTNRVVSITPCDDLIGDFEYALDMPEIDMPFETQNEDD